jgi:hypothetical protein
MALAKKSTLGLFFQSRCPLVYDVDQRAAITLTSLFLLLQQSSTLESLQPPAPTLPSNVLVVERVIDLG